MISFNTKATPYKKLTMRNFIHGIDTFGDIQDNPNYFLTLDNVEFIEKDISYRKGHSLISTTIEGQPTGHCIVYGNPNKLLVVKGKYLYYFNNGIGSNPTVITSALLTNNSLKKALVNAKIMDMSTPLLIGTTTNTVLYTYKIEDNTKSWAINQWVGKAIDIGSNGITVIASNTATEIFFETELPSPPQTGATYIIYNIVDGVIVTNPKSGSETGSPITFSTSGTERVVDDAFSHFDFASIACTYKERTFYAGFIGSGEDASKLRWSIRGLGEVCNQKNYLYVGNPSARFIDMQEVNGMLVMFKEDGIFILTGTDEATFSIRQLSNIVPRTQGGIAKGENVIYFMSYDGVRRFTGYESLNLKPEFPFSEQIKSELESLTYQQLNSAVSTLYDQKYILQIGAKQFVLNLKESREAEHPVWTTNTTTNPDLQSVYALVTFQENSTVKDVSLCISNSGYVYRRDYSNIDDTGYPITWTVMTADIDLGDETVDKIVELIKIMGDNTNETFIITVSISYDQGNSWTTVGTTDRSLDKRMTEMMIRGQFSEKFRLKFVGTIPEVGLTKAGTSYKAILLSRLTIYYILRGLNIIK